MTNRKWTSTVQIEYDNKVTVIVLAVICCLLWGTAFPVLKISYRELNLSSDDVFTKMVFAGMRFMLAGMMVFIYCTYRDKKIPKLTKSSFMPFLIFGIFNTTLQYFFFYTGVANTTAIKGVLLDTSKPLFVVLLAHFVSQNDRINFNKVLGLILGFVGIIIANLDSAAQGLTLDVSLYGEGYLVFASVAYAIAAIYGKAMSKKYDTTIMNAYQFIFGSTILLIGGLITSGGFHLRFNLLASVLLIYSGFLSAVAFVIWFNLLKYNKATSVTIFSFLIPIFGTIISSTILPGERISVNILISLILSAIGIFLVNNTKRQS